MKKILYVEDDPINALVLQKLLGGIYSVAHVEDGETSMLRVQQESFDMILMDINLGRGKIDGIETMKQIKVLASYQLIPIVAVTSYAMPEDRARFLQQGFDGYLAKPLERPILLAYLSEFFQ